MKRKVLPFCPLCKVPIEGDFYSGLTRPVAKNSDDENSVRILNDNEELFFCPVCESGEVILPKLNYAAKKIPKKATCECGHSFCVLCYKKCLNEDDHKCPRTKIKVERKNGTTDEEEKEFLADQNIVAKCRKEGVEYCKFAKVIRECAFYWKCTECGYQICTYCKKKYTEGHELYPFKACHPMENERMTNIVCSFLCVPLMVMMEIICAPFILCYYQCSLCGNNEKIDFNISIRKKHSRCFVECFIAPCLFILLVFLIPILILVLFLIFPVICGIKCYYNCKRQGNSDQQEKYIFMRRKFPWVNPNPY
ncbi:unnamed protein product [Moneuplotes crassus]|uniref:RING-type domain-containing protein n=1 Tax=Euplotes crassus TaxID=5936 RepID=A0AAD1US72_EUPCR|nr:unnamed protein product [Moneuplotes crassus]